MDLEKIAILRRMYTEGSSSEILLSRNHATLAELLPDLLAAAEVANHLVLPEGVRAVAEALCEVMYPELPDEYRTLDPVDFQRAAKILQHVLDTIELNMKGPGE